MVTAMKRAGIKAGLVVALLAVPFSAHALAAGLTPYKGEMRDGKAPVKATVKLSKSGEPKVIEKLSIGKPGDPYEVECDGHGPIGVTADAEDLKVDSDRSFTNGTLPGQAAHVEGRFTRSGVMKGEFSYHAFVDFGDGSGDHECETPEPAPFKADGR